ncbi:phenylalanine--tRNA ligase subunit beta [Thermosphaera chiliense]|uniref:phenylalanine--tRNA ligase n=1 Tax=Thermosphaera chiliense TaxID=3402707 RepID=A0A7M1USY2_9CREN|nr:phenylalanine--tRNA ligase subunit beta [Thermosphaera aggregans]QOR94192.1 phenylalanine--tRNA ligase subunit beta [Thermosphaera aggregans]
MPTIRVSIRDLERLLGKQLSGEDVKKYLPFLKCEIEMLENDLLEYEANHDRPDIFSAEGLARGLRPFMGLASKELQFKPSSVKGFAEDIPERPYVALAVVRDLSLDDEAVRQIMQLQEKLASTYGRDRRKASIGVYDLDKITPPVYYKLADPDSTFFIPLEASREMSLRKALEETKQGQLYGYIIAGMRKYPVLADSTGQILSLAPIVNGETSKVDVRTRNILIDSTSIDKETAINLVTIMALNIAERSSSGIVEIVEVSTPTGEKIVSPKTEAQILVLNVDEVNGLLGTRLEADDIAQLLRNHYYEIIQNDGKKLKVKVPLFRLDVKSWVDVAEDVSISLGYHVLGAEADSLPPSTHPGRIHPIEAFSRKIRDILIGMGYTEVSNYIMSNEFTQLTRFGLKTSMYLVSNPKSERFTGLRVWLTPGLLDAVVENSSKQSVIKIFEVGDVIMPGEGEGEPVVERKLGVAISHEKSTLTDGLSLIASIFDLINAEYKFLRDKNEGFLEERFTSIYVNGERVGFVGEIHPKILYELGVANPVVVAEVSLSKLIKLIQQY